MQNTGRIEMADALAAFAHRGQVDKAGQPYIQHPRTVASRVTGEDEKIVALLHDVLEDTDVAEDTIRNLFGDKIADAVAALTHREDEDYFSYVARVAKNPLARIVKLADLEHNMDLSRLPKVTEKDLRRVEKYSRARRILMAA